MATKQNKYLFFDFGGVLDSHGIHTRVLFWDAVVKAGLLPSSEEKRREFQEAYTAADQEMMKTGSALGMGLARSNEHNLSLIFKHLGKPSVRVGDAAGLVSDLQIKCLAQSLEVLERLDFGKSIISNFTGNLEVILKEAGLYSHFEHINESYYVGAAKPDIEIFLHALSRVDFAPEDCVFIGDNIKNDMEPARELGLKTVLFDPEKKHRPGQVSDFVIGDLGKLLTLNI